MAEFNDERRLPVLTALAKGWFGYLQDKGLRLRFYTSLRKTRVATARQDPFCLQALEKETGMGIEELEKDFLRWLEAQPAAK